VNYIFMSSVKETFSKTLKPKMLVDYLIEESKLEKILFPNKKFRSSLYKQIGAPYFAYLDDAGVKRKIAHSKRK
jgi:hypothetical protein